jgi:hypothetical protein
MAVYFLVVCFGCSPKFFGDRVGALPVGREALAFA